MSITKNEFLDTARWYGALSDDELKVLGNLYDSGFLGDLIFNRIDDEYEKGFKAGHDEGYEGGYEKGFDTGHDEGYDAARENEEFQETQTGNKAWVDGFLYGLRRGVQIMTGW